MSLPIRLLHLPNEPYVGFQQGPRRFFREARLGGRIQDYLAHSFLVERKNHSDAASMQNDLLSQAETFLPNVVFWQHISDYPITADFIARLKNLPSKPLIVYHEADMFGGIAKVPTKSMRILASAADLMFVVGLGQWARTLDKLGAKQVVYAPHCFDEARFGGEWTPTPKREFDAIMIASLLKSRNPLPGFSIPGAAGRLALAKRLYRLLGKRFAVFGAGWEKYPFSRGTIPFDEQEKVIRNSWMSVVWDHYESIPYYFSDRLPISLAAGVAHLTNYHPGYELLFNNGEQLLYPASIDGFESYVRYYLDSDARQLIDLGDRGKRLAATKYSTEVVYDRMLSQIERLVDANNPQ
ncbi:MAG TPA: hypothetical protein DD435_05770 [Cyanobacteria bacterium UBA8530]|nr:hypothetical protein [Cyanobacteria bacterium UBA8530]